MMSMMVLPPRFGHIVQNKADKSTRLEDSSGEKWDVKFSKVDGLFAFGKGWNKFALEHNLKLGDLLVFHYIMESHFVVMMYGKSGCREIRHFGISQRQTKETKQKNKLIEDGSPSNNGTNDHHYSKGSGSQPEVVGCDGSGKKNLVAGGGGSDDIYTNEVRKRVEKK
ncbi:putative B3 domain-containing protein isoform X1 [Tanacetum coccineum]